MYGLSEIHVFDNQESEGAKKNYLYIFMVVKMQNISMEHDLYLIF